MAAKSRHIIKKLIPTSNWQAAGAFIIWLIGVLPEINLMSCCWTLTTSAENLYSKSTSLINFRAAWQLPVNIYI
jgi:hypothetical protein